MFGPSKSFPLGTPGGLSVRRPQAARIFRACGHSRWLYGTELQAPAKRDFARLRKALLAVTWGTKRPKLLLQKCRGAACSADRLALGRLAQRKHPLTPSVRVVGRWHLRRSPGTMLHRAARYLNGRPAQLGFRFCNTHIFVQGGEPMTSVGFFVCTSLAMAFL